MAKNKRETTENVEEKSTTTKVEKKKIDKALYEVTFIKRWLKPDDTVAEVGDRLSVDKQTYDELIKYKLVKEI